MSAHSRLHHRSRRATRRRHRRAPACAGALAALLVAAAAAQTEAPYYGEAYMTRELRAAVDRLKADVASSPTDETNVAERALVLADWVDAYALAGGEVGLDGPAVRLYATLPPKGSAAIAAGKNVDRLVREFTLRAEPGALGELSAESLGPFVARSYATVRQTWKVGTHPMVQGGGFWVARHFNATFGPFQTGDSHGDGYVSIATSNPDAELEATTFMASGPHGGFRSPEPAIAFRLVSGQLDPGDTVTITYGDRSGGGSGLLMPTSSSARMPLPLYIDLDASGEWRPLPLEPFVVIGTGVTGVHGFAPTIVEPGERFELSVRAEDPYFNRASGEIPAFDVAVDGRVVASTPEGREPISLVQLSIADTGPHWITLRSHDGKIRGEANPVLVVANPERRIYWGETHGHSGYAEGIGTVDAYMQFARDDARLDYVTHSEHDSWLDDGEWELMRRTSAAYDAPGRFIPFLGWEWTRAAPWGGHHNVLLRNIRDQDRVSGLEFPRLSELYRELYRRFDPDDVLVIPHAHNPGDPRQSDPRLQSLVEMMSMHGSFEWFMKAFLVRGHQVGVVAASDDHLSHPGYSAPSRDSLAQRGGLGAVMAPDHSRDAIFDALKQRRTYATTGDRIILDLTVNGVEMGQRGPFSDSRRIEGRVVGTAPLESITLIKNDQAIWSRDYLTDQGDSSGDAVVQLSFYSDDTPYHFGDAPRGWRHWRGRLRVEGARLDDIAATDFYNPITQNLEPEADGARFATHTRGDWSSLRLRLSRIEPGAAIVLELEDAKETGSAPPTYRPHQTIPGSTVRLALADMAHGRLEHKMPIEGYQDDGILLRRVVADGQRDIQFSYSDSEDPRQGDYYYVRVRQANDAMAWSSPIWIGGYPEQ